MKAIVQDRYGTTDVLRLDDVEQPQVGPDEVRVRVMAAGVHQGDWHMMTGQPYLIRAMGFGVRAPKARIRGNDLAGVVDAVGEGVSDFKAGDEVFGWCHGSFAEFAVANQTSLLAKPANLTFEQAAAIPISGMTALQALRDAGRVKAGQSVLIIGAGGGVGSFAVQIAKAYGAVVTGLCSTSKLDLVRSIGADHVVDYTRDDFTKPAHQYDLIIDTAGRRSVRVLRRALKSNGTLVIVGGEGGGRVLGGFSRQIGGVLLSRFIGQHVRALISLEKRDDLLAVKQLVDEGKVTPVLDRTFELERTPDAIRYLAEGHVAGKVVISPI